MQIQYLDESILVYMSMGCQRQCAWPWIVVNPGRANDPILPFLYNTRTIQRRCFHANKGTSRELLHKHFANPPRNRRDGKHEEIDHNESSGSGHTDGLHVPEPQTSLLRTQALNHTQTTPLIRRHTSKELPPDELAQKSGIWQRGSTSDKGSRWTQDVFHGASYNRRRLLGLDEEVNGEESGVPFKTGTYIPYQKRGSTITDTERAAFRGLFASLTGASEATGAEARMRDGDELQSAQTNTEDQDYAPRMLDEIDERRQLDINSQDFDLESIMETSQLISKDSPNIQRYPLELQGMAAKAQGDLQKKSITEGAKKEPIQEEDQIAVAAATREAQVKEIRRVEELFRRAETDVDLWKILDSEVLQRIRDLHLEDPNIQDFGPQKPKSPLEGNKKFKSKAPKQTPTTNQGDLVLLSKTYPALLLIAARILCRARISSPLVSAILPSIKAIGLSSHVMGASTPLYNELLLHAWRKSHAMRQMLTLLSEMDDAAITLNVKTHDIIDEVTKYRYRALRGDFGDGVQALEDMSERQREGQLLHRWKRRIVARLANSAEEKAWRKAEESRLNQEMRQEDEEAMAMGDGQKLAAAV